ncbi:uncharacterized protein LOC134337640 isoform X1 [Mobula hypostoma]|uniref:uncharacterized protein LOC134337640 isoform X1 n=1 Tax=Mobula hypostoma TaxID=723540 RepID=UPI002FC355C2
MNCGCTCPRMTGVGRTAGVWSPRWMMDLSMQPLTVRFSKCQTRRIMCFRLNCKRNSEASPCRCPKGSVPLNHQGMAGRRARCPSGRRCPAPVEAAEKRGGFKRSRSRLGPHIHTRRSSQEPVDMPTCRTLFGCGRKPEHQENPLGHEEMTQTTPRHRPWLGLNSGHLEPASRRLKLLRVTWSKGWRAAEVTEGYLLFGSSAGPSLTAAPL